MSSLIRTVGIDLGDRKSHLCVLDQDGAVVERSTLSTTPAAFERYFSALPPSRAVLEVGTHSPWISRLLEEAGHEVVVANTCELYGSRRRRKTDRVDAEFLARQGRADPKLLSPVRHRSEQTQADLALIHARDQLVRCRTQLVNHIRGSVKALGQRIPSCSAESFHRKAAAHVPTLLEAALAPLLNLLEQITKQIRSFDKAVEQNACEQHPETARLKQVTGVGALTALTYVLVLEDPKRFTRNRAVGSYLGLTPRLDHSGSYAPELSIHKAGNRLLRRLLVGSAHYVLGPFGPDTDLRRWGLKLASRGGKNAKKRAVVAVARKLSVLLLTLWKSGTEYEPLRSERAAALA